MTQNGQVCVQLLALTKWHCPHSHAAAAAVDRYLLADGPQQQTYSSGFAAVGPCWDRQTDGRTPYRFIEPAPRAMRAKPIKQNSA